MRLLLVLFLAACHSASPRFVVRRVWQGDSDYTEVLTQLLGWQVPPGAPRLPVVESRSTP